MDFGGGILAALGLKLEIFVIGAVMAFVSLLKFGNGASYSEKCATFIGGASIAWWGSGPVTAYFQLKPPMDLGFAVVLALFGMPMAAAIIMLLKELATAISRIIKETDWASILRGILEKIIPGRNGGNK